MKRLVAVSLLCIAPVLARADATLGAFYDPERRLTIGELNWFSKQGQWAAFGFLEAYRNPTEGFPPESNVLFGKTWVMREVTKSLSLGVELEHGYNNAGMWTRNKPFEQDQFRVIPKFGASFRLN